MHPKRGLLPFQEKIKIPIEGGSIINCRRFARTAGALTLAAALCLTGTACAPAQTPETTAAPTQAPTQATTQPATEAVEQVEKSAASHGTGALPVKALTPKAVDVNPYMASVDPNIHGDGYNTDSTDEIMPLGIYPEINVSYETTNANASPAVFFDNYNHSVVPLLGGIAIRDIDAQEATTLGYFSPPRSMTAAATSSRAPIPLWTRKTGSSAPPATTRC